MKMYIWIQQVCKEEIVHPVTLIFLAAECVLSPIIITNSRLIDEEESKFFHEYNLQKQTLQFKNGTECPNA